MKQKNLLIASGSAADLDGLKNAFHNLEEIRLLSSVSNGVDAVDTMLTRDVDLLLLDLFLPKLDGIGVLKRIALFSEDRRPLTFVMTAFADDRLLLSIKDQILYCFSKPLDYSIVQLRVLELTRLAEQDINSADSTVDQLESLIAAGIRAIGVPAHLKGYYYLRDAIRLYALSSSPVDLSITNDIYPSVAKVYNTRAPLVEHAIRNAIEIAWTRGNLDVIHEYFGYTINDCKGKPSNREFIAMMAERALTYVNRRA